MSLLNLLEEFVMFEKIRKLKNKKGFTLAELIVVLVILAILAALLIPALTGYIDKAREQSIQAETRMIVMAVQTESTTAYGKDQTKFTTTGSFTANELADVVSLAEVKALSETTPKAFFTATVDKNGAVVELTYYDGANSCKYTASSSSYEVKLASKGAVDKVTANAVTWTVS